MSKMLKTNEGFVILTVLIFMTISLIGGGAYLYLVTGETNLNKGQVNSAKAYYLAETGIERAIYEIKNGNTTDFAFTINPSGGTALNCLEDVNINVAINNTGSDLYEIISTCSVGSSQREIHAIVYKNPPSKVFDYSYFINNWGWFYGGGITSHGDVRSNGRFDFRSNPRVNGQIYAGQEIDDGGDGIQGDGGDAENQHPNSSVLPMPNLENLTYYENLAISEGGTLSHDGTTIISGVYGDDASEVDNIVLIGTPSKPIDISGPVVVRGDVIIKGTIRGQGTIYAGRNIYIAGDLKYKNAPSSPRPASGNAAVVDAWVAAHSDDDIVGLAAKETIVMGNYTNSTNYGYSGSDRWWADYWLFSMGSEDVGQDGIPDTNDTDEDNGTFQSEYEDLDGDGVFDDDYTWSDVETQAPVTDFANLPAGVVDFGDLATNDIKKIEGILYTNHAYTGRTGNNILFNGALVSKDEAIIYRNKITFNYDERVHSRYRTDPNWLINLNLPVAMTVELKRKWEE